MIISSKVCVVVFKYHYISIPWTISCTFIEWLYTYTGYILNLLSLIIAGGNVDYFF